VMSGGWEGNRKSGVALYAPIHSTEAAIGIRDDDDDNNDVMASRGRTNVKVSKQ